MLRTKRIGLNIKEVRPYGLRRQRDSLAAFNRVIESKSNHAPAYYNKGSLLIDLGRFAKAWATLEKAQPVRLSLRQNIR
ncbi:MAG: hypothetical protein E2O77_11800 [Caldithrix sp.]|nr:MAG: hypothetical protein E2O77_11800 [Caldithrix sp.]